MTADELARFQHDAANRWMRAQNRSPFVEWDGLQPWQHELYLAVAEAILRELGCPAPLVVDVWTREPPRADGYCWFRWIYSREPEVVLVRGGQVRVGGQWGPITSLSGHWWGPILPPEEGGRP